jgi:hypothetical protein
LAFDVVFNDPFLLIVVDLYPLPASPIFSENGGTLRLDLPQ